MFQIKCGFVEFQRKMGSFATMIFQSVLLVLATMSKHSFYSPNGHEIYVSLRGYEVSRLYDSFSLHELHV